MKITTSRTGHGMTTLEDGTKEYTLHFYDEEGNHTLTLNQHEYDQLCEQLKDKL